MILWTDVETTGFSPVRDQLLEICCVVTDDQLKQIANFQRVVYTPIAAQICDLTAEGTVSRDISHVGLLENGQTIDQIVIDMHLINGLWKNCMRGVALDTVDRELADFIQTCAMVEKTKTDNGGMLSVSYEGPRLGGSTVSFDRGFIAQHLPRADKKIHYRNLDVSSITEAAYRFWPSVHAARPRVANKAHRGMSDILESIDLARYYAKALGPAQVTT